MKLYRPCALAATAAVTLALAGGSASAASGNGAQVVDTESCFEDPARGTFCQNLRQVFNVSEAGSSGNVNVTFVSRLEGTYTGTGVFEGCSSEQSDRDNTHVLTTADGEQVFHFSGKSQFANTCSPGGSFNCETQFNITYANGELRHDATRFTCDEPLAP